MAEYSKFLGPNVKNVATWNFATGCTKISAGCDHCYAELLSKRNQGRKNVAYTHYSNGFDLAIHTKRLQEPNNYHGNKLVFVNTASDLFHNSISFDLIRNIFEVMEFHRQHIFAFMTKRSKRLLKLAPQLHWAPNIWAGVSVEDRANAYRIDDLRQIGAQTKFVSFEPLLGEIGTVNLNEIDWIIIGGETEVRARPMHPNWALQLIAQCIPNGIPIFYRGSGRWATLENIIDDDFKFRIQEQLQGRLFNYQTPVAQHRFSDGLSVFKLKSKNQGSHLINGCQLHQLPDTGDIDIGLDSTEDIRISNHLLNTISHIPTQIDNSFDSIDEIEADIFRIRTELDQGN